VCCSVLQCVAVCCSVLQCVAVCCSVLQCAAVCYSVLQCVAVCCSVPQCVAVRHSHRTYFITVDSPGAVSSLHAIAVEILKSQLNSDSTLSIEKRAHFSEYVPFEIFRAHKGNKQVHEHHVECAVDEKIQDPQLRHLAVVTPVGFGVEEKDEGVAE